MGVTIYDRENALFKTSNVVLCCVVDLRPCCTSTVMSGRSVNLNSPMLGRLRPPKRLTSTSLTQFCQQLTTVLQHSAEGETTVCGRTGLLKVNRKAMIRN